ncbi:MAG: DoxX family protein [Planctomycetes bacterium]|nr:DoxX family protein [Planctomycetota bacterium]
MSVIDTARAAGDTAIRLLGRLSWLPPLAARITVGWVFLESGWGKLHHLDKVTEFFRSLHIPAPEIQAPFAAGTELVCGALLLVGLLTRLASIPLMVVMTVAIATAKRDELKSLSDLFGFPEFLYILLLLWLLISGPGAISLDRLLFRPRAQAPKPAA